MITVRWERTTYIYRVLRIIFSKVDKGLSIIITYAKKGGEGFGEVGGGGGSIKQQKIDFVAYLEENNHRLFVTLFPFCNVD